MIFKSLEHIGVPHTDPMEGEVYVERLKMYVVRPENTPFKYEYVRYLEGSPFPEELHHNIHIAGMVDSIDEAIQEVDEVLVPKMEGSVNWICFAKKDGVILEFMEQK